MTTKAPAEIHLHTDRHTGHRYHRVRFHKITGTGYQWYRVWVIRERRHWFVYSQHSAFNYGPLSTRTAALEFIARTKAELGAL